MMVKFNLEQLHEKCKTRADGYRMKILELSKQVGDSLEISYEDYKKVEDEFKLPSRLEMAKNVIQAAKEAIQKGFDSRTPEEVQQIMDICIQCPKYIENGPRCGFCGCFLKAKTQLKAWHCPLKKW